MAGALRAALDIALSCLVHLFRAGGCQRLADGKRVVRLRDYPDWLSVSKTAVALIAIDFSTLDHLGGGGQYRYCVSLLRALASLDVEADFLVLGSGSEAVPQVRELVAGRPQRWRYARFEHSRGRASYWIDQLNYARLLRREGVALFHSLHGLALLLAPCPVVITQHDLMDELFPEYELARKSRPYRINRWAVRRLAKRVICISEATARDLHDLWAIDKGRIDVVPHGSEFSCAVDPRDDGRIHAGLARERPSDPVLVSLYNLEPRKNLSGLLAAVVKLREQYPSLKLLLFGRAAVTPEREAEFQRMVRDLKLDDVIEQTGFIKDESGFTARAMSSCFRRFTRGLDFRCWRRWLRVLALSRAAHRRWPRLWARRAYWSKQKMLTFSPPLSPHCSKTHAGADNWVKPRGAGPKLLPCSGWRN